MPVVLHPRAEERAAERGATTNEVIATIERGESFPARLGRTLQFGVRQAWLPAVLPSIGDL